MRKIFKTITDKAKKIKKNATKVEINPDDERIKREMAYYERIRNANPKLDNLLKRRSYGRQKK